MAQLFPKWTNKLPVILAVITIVAASGVYGFFAYYGSPWYTDVGYQPEQPVMYSHKRHAGEYAIDCRYCHSYIEVSQEANIPPTQTCMNCHMMILAASDSLAPVQASWANNNPIKWVRVHKLPEYVYFDHSVHLRAGVGCVVCHGRIDTMTVVQQAKPLSMSWCLECHRNPDPYLRPVSEITNMTWQPSENHAAFVAQFKKEKNIAPPEDCSACHR